MNHPYRMVFINEDSLDEVASFHLTKKSVYTLFSTIFLITILATVAILVLTPLRYYVPGYGSNSLRVQTLKLERQVDSLSALAEANIKHSERIQKLIAGKDVEVRDTAMLKPELLKSAPEGILPAGEEIREQAGVKTQKEKARGRRKK
jgi:type IV secretory pathway component VirB8